jgi:predicted DNA-binding transcriptional regulator AlpA
MSKKQVDKRVGGTKRAAVAREFIADVMKNEAHPMRYSKDIDFARKFDVSRHTIYKIRRDLSIPDRLERVLDRLKNVDTAKTTMRELCALLNVKYAGLYKIVNENKLPVKSDLKPPPNTKRARAEV